MADGAEVAFDLSLTMACTYREETNERIRLGDAARQKDPLVINFGGTAAQLSSTRFTFDLDADGQAESLRFVAPGSGFLALDRDGDGAITDGRQLFGPQSGDGFADLTVHDADGNGWIDAADPVFDQLPVWSLDATGRC